MLILDLWGISFHTVVVFALGKNFLFKFALGHCGMGLGDNTFISFNKIISWLYKLENAIESKFVSIKYLLKYKAINLLLSKVENI